jgi:hypothetical protein
MVSEYVFPKREALINVDGVAVKITAIVWGRLVGSEAAIMVAKRCQPLLSYVNQMEFSKGNFRETHIAVAILSSSQALQSGKAIFSSPSFLVSNKHGPYRLRNRPDMEVVGFLCFFKGLEERGKLADGVTL